MREGEEVLSPQNYNQGEKGFELEGYFFVFNAINSKSEIEETSIFGPPFIPLWIASE